MSVELPRLLVEKVTAVPVAGGIALVNRDPAPDEAGAPRAGTIGLQLVCAGAEGVVRYATRVWVDGVLAFRDDPFPGFDGPRAAVVETPDSLTVVIDPVTPFESLAQVEVRVASRASATFQTIDETYTFEVEDLVAPRVLAAGATSRRAVEVAFDEPVVAAEPSLIVLEAIDAPAVTPLVESAVTAGEVLTVRLNTEMTPGARYRVTASGVVDRLGNPAAAPYDSAVFGGFAPQAPPGRSFDLWTMLPRYNRDIDTTGELAGFVACLQEVTDLLLAEIDGLTDVFDIERAAEAFVDLMLLDLGNPFRFDLGPLEKQKLASVLVELYKQKGTAVGIVNAVRFFMGLEVEVLPFAMDTLSLGEAQLGVDFILGPSSRFALYAFNVRVDQVLSERQRRRLRKIVDLIKPGHTHFVDLLEPLRRRPSTTGSWA